MMLCLTSCEMEFEPSQGSAVFPVDLSEHQTANSFAQPEVHSRKTRQVYRPYHGVPRYRKHKGLLLLNSYPNVVSFSIG